jgi:hypothetical protein
MKKPAPKNAYPSDEANRSCTVRLSNETAAKVTKIAGERAWTFSKTLGILIEKALDAKVLKWVAGLASGSRSRKQRGNRNEKGIHRDRGGGFDRMSSAVLPVLLAVGVSVCVFLVAWWLVGKL